jgi:ribosomal protein L24E
MSAPKTDKPCEHCNAIYNGIALMKYCSKSCKKKAWRKIHGAEENIKRNIIRKEKKPIAYCNYCAGIINIKNGVRFCSKEHNARFFSRKRYNKSVPLQITPKVLIWTNKYDKIQDIISKYREHMNPKNINENGKHH